MSANLFNRYVWLVDVIHRAGRISFEAINERWVVSSLNPEGEDLPLRTFHNHIIAVQQMFDINIECDRKNGYGYYIENADELARDGVRSWLLSTFAVNNLISDSRELRSRIVFENIPSGQRFLAPIIEAMRDGAVLEVIYHPFWNSPFDMRLEPYFVKVFRQRWYVIGRASYCDEVRIFALDRIKSLEATEERFELPADFSPDDFFAHCYGIEHRDDPERVVLRVAADQADYFRALPLHPSQKEEVSTDTHTDFSYFLCAGTYDFKQAVLSFMDKVEVLAPESLRTGLATIIRNLVAKYN